MKHLGLFEGIGGFSLAGRWMGWQTVAYSEINHFCRKVLKYHFPNAEVLGDITKTDFTKYAETIDILTGGFPCQPFSLAGKRKGTKDDRHLWPEMLRAIREIKPKYIVGENVYGLLNWDGGLVFEQVQTDLEAEGYEVQAFILPACGVGAPHKRDRIWFIAHASDVTRQQKTRQEREKYFCKRSALRGNTCTISRKRTFTYSYGNARRGVRRYKVCKWRKKEKFTKFGNLKQNEFATNTQRIRGRKVLHNLQSKQPNGQGINTHYEQTNWEKFPTQAPICDGDDGLSTRLDAITFPKWRTESIKGGGNAIVPQVAYKIFKAIEENENNNITN